MYVMLAFLEFTGVYVDCSNEDIAYSAMRYEELLEWVKKHRM